MAGPVLNIHDVSQAIQLALGPVFLLTGIAGILNVMAGRLARIIDRGRALTEGAPQAAALQAALAPHAQAGLLDELRSLERRRHLASAAITACTLAALLVCMVIAALFLEVILDAPLKWLVGLLFTGATLTLVVGLALFLREVHLATRTIRIAAPPGSTSPRGSTGSAPQL
ncbi:MAG: DUF2721 domain-containing protein [Rubrivivax sp.]|nr:DUF2721 domain-containing protein [Rubrivivax sp.]